MRYYGGGRGRGFAYNVGMGVGIGLMHSLGSIVPLFLLVFGLPIILIVGPIYLLAKLCSKYFPEDSCKEYEDYEEYFKENCNI